MRTGRILFRVAVALVTLVALAGVAMTQGVLFVKNDRVGIGEDNPTQGLLTLKTDDGTGAGFKVETTNASSDQQWFFQQNAVTGAFLISNLFGGAAQFQIFPAQSPSTFVVRGNKVGIGTQDPQGKLDVRGTIVNSTTQHHADYVFEPDYELESIEDHAAYMWENKHLKAVGAGKYSEDGMAVFNLTDRSQAVLEELEKAHIYIERLNTQVNELHELVTEQRALLEELSVEKAGS